MVPDVVSPRTKRCFIHKPNYHIKKVYFSPKKTPIQKMIIDLQQNLIIVPFTHKVKMLYVLANVAIRVSITAILQLKL